MSSKLYIGNLSWGVSTEDLRAAFEQYGEIEDAIVMTDRETGRSRGFGFVTFTNAEDAAAAIEAMHETELDGRPLTVNEARTKREF